MDTITYKGKIYTLTEDASENAYNEFTRDGLKYDLAVFDWCADCENKEGQECMAFWHTSEGWTEYDGTENAADWGKPDLVIVID